MTINYNRVLRIPFFCFGVILSLCPASLIYAEIATYPEPAKLDGLNNLKESALYQVRVSSGDNPKTSTYKTCVVYSSDNVTDAESTYTPNQATIDKLKAKNQTAITKFTKRTEEAVSFTSFTCGKDDIVTVEVTVLGTATVPAAVITPTSVVITPTRLGITPSCNNTNVFTFTLTGHAKVMLQVNGKSHPLLIFSEPPEVLPAYQATILDANTPITTPPTQQPITTPPITKPITIPQDQSRQIKGTVPFSQRITINNRGTLYIAPNAVLTADANSNAEIVIEAGGKLIIGSGAVLQLSINKAPEVKTLNPTTQKTETTFNYQEPIKAYKPIQIKEKGEVYIAGGAIVEGTFNFTDTYNHYSGNNNKFSGRGILTSGHISWALYKDSEYNSDRNMTQFCLKWGRGNAHQFEGLMLLNSPGWTAREELTNSSVKNIKQISWNGNSDAFHLNRNCTMEDSFFFINDDALILGTKKSTGFTASDNTWSRCTVSPGNWGHPIIIQPNDNQMQNNTWEDIDIIGDFLSGLPAIHIKGDYTTNVYTLGSIKNFNIRNVRIDSPRKGPLFKLNTTTTIKGEIVNHTGYKIDGFRMENITATAKKSSTATAKESSTVVPEIELVYNNSDGAHQSIEFNNITIGGKTLTQSHKVNTTYFTQPSTVLTRYSSLTVTVDNPVKLNTIPNPAAIPLNSGEQTVLLSGIYSPAVSTGAPIKITATSANTALIPSLTVSYTNGSSTGSLLYTPVANAKGTAEITVTVDGGETASIKNSITRKFTVTVNDVLDIPTLNTIPNQTIDEGSGTQTVGLSGIYCPGTTPTTPITLTATSANTALIPNQAENLSVRYTSPNSTGSLSYKPVPNASGTAEITVTATKGTIPNSTNSIIRRFTVTVKAVNDAPSISEVADQTVNANTATQALQFTVSDRETAAGSLRVSGKSSNTTLLPDQNIVLSGSDGKCTVTLTPAPNQSGTANVTLTVSDGVQSISETFQLTVTPLNALPQTLYWDANGPVVGAGGATPAGTWGSGTFWSTNATGSLATVGYVSGSDVHFSAGSDATGTYTVTLAGSQSANSLTFGAGVVTLSGGRELRLTGSKGEVNVAKPCSASISSVVAGTNGLTKSGGGKLTLSGANSYTGPTTINEGTLWVNSLADVGGGKTALGAPVTTGNSSIIINDLAALCYGGLAASTNRNFVLGGIGGAIYNNGTGQLTLTGTITGSGQLVLRGTSPVAINGKIGDQISHLVKTDTSTVTLANSTNSFSGGAYIFDGTLRVSSLADSGAVCALGKGNSVQLGQNRPAGVATLQYFGTSVSSDRAISIASAGAGSGGTLENTTPNTTLTLTGRVSIVADAKSPTLTLTGVGNGVLGGEVSGDGLTIKKTGTGTWTIVNSPTHTGSTEVSAGTLKVNGSLNTGAALAVNAGARLSGSGTITIPATLSGTHAPGDGLGTQRFSDNLTYAASSRLEWELGSNTAAVASQGTAYDKVEADSVTVQTGAVVDVVLNRAGSTVDFSTPFWSAPQSWVVLTATNLNAEFKLGSVTSDCNKSPAANFGAFSLKQDNLNGKIYLMWKPKGMRGTMVGSSSWGGVTNVRTGSYYSISGRGNGIAGTADNFWFESTAYAGNFQAKIRFKGITTSGAKPRAGLMLRESTEPGARFVMLAAAPSTTTTTTYWTSARLTANAAPYPVETPRASYQYQYINSWEQDGWMRLVRRDDLVTLATSKNGVDFVDAVSYTLSSLPATVEIGMFVSSGSSDVNCTSNLSDFELVPLLNAMPPQPYDAWISGYAFASGADTSASGDPDGDGLANLIEYALGLNPTVVNASTTQPSVVSDGGQNYLQISVRRNPAVTHIRIEGESTGTLDTPTSWKSLDTVIISNTPSEFIVRDRIPIGTQGKRFLRLRFTLVP